MQLLGAYGVFKVVMVCGCFFGGGPTPCVYLSAVGGGGREAT